MLVSGADHYGGDNKMLMRKITKHLLLYCLDNLLPTLLVCFLVQAKSVQIQWLGTELINFLNLLMLDCIIRHWCIITSKYLDKDNCKLLTALLTLKSYIRKIRSDFMVFRMHTTCKAFEEFLWMHPTSWPILRCRNLKSGGYLHEIFINCP